MPRHLLPFAARLGSLGGQCASAPNSAQELEAVARAAGDGQPLALVVGTGGTEASILELARTHYKEYCKASCAADESREGG